MPTQGPTFEFLEDHCLFCNPARHGQESQILLRSNNFYLFAGLGAIVDGYVIITPYRCDNPELRLRSLSEAPPELMDELGYLRGIVSDFYHDKYENPGLSFEHGQAGGCLFARKGTQHCYHAHLCCYPRNFRLWEDIEDLPVEPLGGLHELPSRAASAPYLYMEAVEIDETLSPERAEREKWHARIVRLGEDTSIQSQYLRRLLAKRVGELDLWDWRAQPREEAAQQLASTFRKWLQEQSHYGATWKGGKAYIDFYSSILHSNAHGNDDVSLDFHHKWSFRLQNEAIGRFLRRLPKRDKDRIRILDAGCGPGNYTRVFYNMGFDCVGIDFSDKMLEIARGVINRHCKAEPNFDSPSSPRLLKMDAITPDFPEASFDAIWYSALLVHVPRIKLSLVLKKLHRILRHDGILYISAQIGGGVSLRWEGRVFFYYQEEEIRAACLSAGFDIVEEWGDIQSMGSRGDKRDKVWRHFILAKHARQYSDLRYNSTASLQLGQLGEQKILSRIIERLPKIYRHIDLEAGDDCAAFHIELGEVVVVTTDPCPLPVISMLGESNRATDGWFSMVIGLSDLAAMGAKPLGMLLALEAQEKMPVGDLDAFYRGALEAAVEFDCPILGGNVKDAPRFNCVGTALGAVEKNKMLRRDAARPGQHLVVLGEMGHFWAGVLYKLENVRLKSEEAEILLTPLQRPRPRLREGRVLADLGLSQCAMDSSDGLTACFNEIACAGDQIDIHIDLQSLRPDPLVSKVAQATGIDPRKLMLAWGDWQLACTVERNQLTTLEAEMTKLGCPVTTMGWIQQGNGRVWLRDDPLRGVLGELANFASERFSCDSYFSHGLERYVYKLRNQSFFRESKGD